MKQTYKNRRSKPLRVLTGVLGIGIILAVLVLFDGLTGDPLSRAWCDQQALRYARAAYPGQDFTVTESNAGQWFQYGAWVQSAQSADTKFDVLTSFWLQTEGREQELVENRHNTLVRQGREGARQIEALLRKELPGLVIEGNFNDGLGGVIGVEYDLCWTPESSFGAGEYAALFPLDSEFDKAVTQQVPARLCLHISWEGAPTEADLQTVLSQVKAVLDAAGYGVEWYDVTITPQGASHEQAAQQLVESVDETGTPWNASRIAAQ